MSAIFLSASVPVAGRGNYYETANPFLIQFAVRELVKAVIRKTTIVWGGHPAITPMIWAICQDLGVNYAQAVILYQSRFFEAQFPPENANFANIILVDAVAKDREQSLLYLRETMLSRHDFKAAVFIGGMEGVEIEYQMFVNFHPAAKVLPVAATGGGALQLAQLIGGYDDATLRNIDFARLFHTELTSEILE